MYDSEGYWSLKGCVRALVTPHNKNAKVNKFYVFIPSQVCDWDDRSWRFSRGRLSNYGQTLLLHIHTRKMFRFWNFFIFWFIHLIFSGVVEVFFIRNILDFYTPKKTIIFLWAALPCVLKVTSQQQKTHIHSLFFLTCVRNVCCCVLWCIPDFSWNFSCSMLNNRTNRRKGGKNMFLHNFSTFIS